MTIDEQPMKRSFILVLLGLLLSIAASAQDAHFSQFYEAPLLLNPARAGFVNGTFQLTGIYRSQWNEVTMPFKTLSGTVNVNVPAGKNRNNIIGIAVGDLADKSGDAVYTINHFDGTFSYHKNFGADFNRYLGGGLTMSYATTTYDPAVLMFDEDFNNGTNTEIIGSTKSSYFDLSVGFEYNQVDEEHHLNVGIACFHVLQPVVSYSNNAESVIYRKWVGSAGYSLPITEKFDLLPRAAVFFQGPSNEFILGSDLKIKLTEGETTEYSVYAGAYYRAGDAFIPRIRVDMGELSFGISYDFTTSDLKKVSQTAGGPEITLIYVGRIKGISAGRIYNPRF
jgi:type IX secretion system PorP/SprF family membrane protein